MPTPTGQGPIKAASPGLGGRTFPLPDVGVGSSLESHGTVHGPPPMEWASVAIDKIIPFCDGPRLVRNPKWDHIKAAIRSSGGLTAPLSVTRRPGEDVYVCHQGGNTRLLILQELFRETKDLRFATTCVHIVPFDNDFNLAVLHDRENTCRGNLAYIEEAWSKYRLFDIYASNASSKVTVKRFIKDMASEHGIRLTVEAFSRMRYTVEVLYQHVPICLVHGRMSLRAVRRLVSVRSALKKAWRSRELGPDKAFDEAFYGLLERQDQALAEAFLGKSGTARVGPDPRIALDWSRFLQDMQHEFAVAGEVDYQTAGGWIAAACRSLPVNANPGFGPPKGGCSTGCAAAVKPARETPTSLRLASFERARELLDLVELGHLIESRRDSVGYQLTSAPAPTATPMARACWWALTLASTSANNMAEVVTARRGIPSFVDMSPSALRAFSDVLVLQARLKEQEN